jgi:hypothetical protein
VPTPTNVEPMPIPSIAEGPVSSTGIVPASGLFFTVSPAKVILFSVLTLGVYQVVWFYRCWKDVKARRQADIRPLPRAIFGGIFFYSLLSEIQSESDERHLHLRLPVGRGPLAIFYIGAAVLARFVPTEWFLLPAFLCSLPVAVAQSFINSLNERVSVRTRSVLTRWQRLALVPGSVLLVLALIGTYAEPITKWRRERAIDEAFKEIPSFVAIQKYEPVAYSALRKRVSDEVAAGREPSNVSAEIGHEVVFPLLKKYLRRASDDAVNQFGRIFAGTGRRLSETDPDGCAVWLFGKQVTAANPELSQAALTPAEEREMLAVIGKIIESAASKPQAVPDPERASALTKLVVSGLDADAIEGMRVVSSEDFGSRTNRAAACQATFRLYEAIMALPPRDSSTVLRSMLSTDD